MVESLERPAVAGGVKMGQRVEANSAADGRVVAAIEELRPAALTVQLRRAAEWLSSSLGGKTRGPASLRALGALLQRRLRFGEGVKAFVLDPAGVLDVLSGSCAVEAVKVENAKRLAEADVARRRPMREGGEGRLSELLPLFSVPEEARRIACRARHLKTQKMSAAELHRWALSQGYVTVPTPTEAVLDSLAHAGVIVDEGGRVSYSAAAPLAPLGRDEMLVFEAPGTAPSALARSEEGQGAAACAGFAPFEDSFDDMPFVEDLLRGIYSYGFETPSEVQRHLRPMLAGRSVIVRAESGTGKTACFVLGILHLIDCRERACQAVVVSSGREQAQQTLTAVSALGEYLKVSACACVGGSSVREDIRALRRRPHVLVGTTGRLSAMLSGGHVRTKSVRLLVLDEADALGQGGSQALWDLRRRLPRTLQVCCFSATFSESARRSVRALFSDAPLELNVGAQVPAGLRHFYVEVDREQWKLDTLVDLAESLLPKGQVVVFCNTRRKVDFVTEQLRKWDVKCAALHAEFDQRERDLVVREVRSGTTWLLVTAELFERGMDVPQVRWVINFDVPSDADSYVHRCARACRYGRPGCVVSFMRDDDSGDSVMLGTYQEVLGISIDELPMDFAEIL